MPPGHEENIATYKANAAAEKKRKAELRLKRKPRPEPKGYEEAHLAHEEREQPKVVERRQKTAECRRSSSPTSPRSR